MQQYSIDTVLDVGANTGQYASQLRNELGYKKRIISFEPLNEAFLVLKQKSKNDPLWEVHNFALGDAGTHGAINVSANSYSSSLLDMLPGHLKSAPDSVYTGTEVVEIKTIDSIFTELCTASQQILLKIDTQGFEKQVLAGAEQSLPRIDTVQLEMSLIPLYAGGILFNEMWAMMSDIGYTLITIENEFFDRQTGQLLQVDGIFHRS